MRAGRRLESSESSLEANRTRTARELMRLPTALRALESSAAHPVCIAPKLRALAQNVDAV